jgi:hypothetical protein
MPRFPGRSLLLARTDAARHRANAAKRILLVTVGWLRNRFGSGISLGKAIANSFSRAMGAVGLFWVVLINGDRGHPAEVATRCCGLCARGA